MNKIVESTEVGSHRKARLMHVKTTKDEGLFMA